MSTIVYRITCLLAQVLADVPLGTNLGIFHLLFALLSGRFLPARGAVLPALSSLGLSAQAVRRSEAALCYGRWHLKNLLDQWQKQVKQEGHFVPSSYEGVQPVACDLTAFFRPQLQGLTSKHYVSLAGKALPAVVFGLSVAVGQVGSTRLGVPRLILRRAEDENEATLQTRLVRQVQKTLSPEEAAIVDAGFGLSDLLSITDLPFVARVRTNQSARRNFLPVYAGKGARPKRGELVRPLARTRKGKTIAATAPDAIVAWRDGKYALEAHVWNDLVLPDQKPGARTFGVVAIYDPRYKEPLLLATTLAVSAWAVWRLYRDRWAVEHLPLAAKSMLGAERSFVFGQESRFRLPELALLAGNLLSYVAATSAPVASGFWDRAARPTCGRLRRVLAQVHSAELPVPSGELRKKESVTSHLKTGVEGHRRQKAIRRPFAPKATPTTVAQAT
jgi:hypothetical protein